MRFIVRRSSDWFSIKKPCEEAVLLSVVINNDKGYYTSVEEYEKDNGIGSWGKLLANKEEMENSIQEQAWLIEINSLEELLEFKKKYNKPIIINENYNSNNKEFYEIEIYDDYRE